MAASQCVFALVHRVSRVEFPQAAAFNNDVGRKNQEPIASTSLPMPQVLYFPKGMWAKQPC
jgi:hypothetical protein